MDDVQPGFEDARTGNKAGSERELRTERSARCLCTAPKLKDSTGVSLQTTHVPGSSS
ncbi:hypothetical protein ASPBRDRAFT_37940 [Aspergillus brasiliensis CBS 101740]|uniref:Uncharacterized protein n=1 Tax=Aspergillus brasiliensis (strain CBS 101740 / IMI 381727 / IBT 21946) TaxID=767769 RepID=A0A1L9UVQ5_ASPBC|nr:hypothetical protein ASPBRDRAFT_37940 [Aspergillus brasiliensis CBS 101740]